MCMLVQKIPQNNLQLEFLCRLKVNKIYSRQKLPQQLEDGKEIEIEKSVDQPKSDPILRLLNLRI